MKRIRREDGARSVTTGAEGLLPLISSNVLPGEGADTDYPILRLAIDIVLGRERAEVKQKKRKSS